MEMQRLFVALALPDVVRDELAALMLPLDGARWTAPEKLHLTMRFVGDADAERRERFAEALTRVRVEPFILAAEGVGVFPTRGPAKVLWAGLGRAHTRLFQLRKQIDEALLAIDLTLDVHNFQPHITLGRIGETHDPKELAKFLERQAKFESPPFRVSEFQLVASQRDGGGASRYEVVRAFALEK